MLLLGCGASELICQAVDSLSLAGNKLSMNRELIRQQLVGQGPLVIRTSDCKEFPVPHPEFVFVGRHNIVIEDAKGLLDIIDPLHVVSIRPGTRRKPYKATA
jgi:hypothetical protein